MVATCGPHAYWTEKDRQNEMIWGSNFGLGGIFNEMSRYLRDDDPGSAASYSAKDTGLIQGESESNFWTSSHTRHLHGYYGQLKRASAQLAARWAAVELNIKDTFTSVTIPAEVIVPSSKLMRLPEVYGFHGGKEVVVEREDDPSKGWKPLTKEITLVGSGFDNLDLEDPIAFESDNGVTVEKVVDSLSRTDNQITLKLSVNPNEDFSSPAVVRFHLKMLAHYRETANLLPETPSTDAFSGGEYLPIKQTLTVKAKPVPSSLRLPFAKKVYYSNPVVLKRSADGKEWERTEIDFSIVGENLDTVDSLVLTNGTGAEHDVVIPKEDLEIVQNVITMKNGKFMWTPRDTFAAPTLFAIQLKLKKMEGAPEEVLTAGIIHVAVAKD